MAAPSTSNKGLGRVAAKSAVVVMITQFAKLLIQFCSIIFLARLLEPSDFGLIAMVAVVIGIGEVVRDFGLSSAAIQATSINNAQRSNLFWINVAIGVALALIVWLIADIVAVFFDHKELIEIMHWLALTFIISGMSAQFKAQLNRNMKFASLGVTEVLSQLMALVVAVVMAYKGMGYYALIGQQIAVQVFLLLMLLYSARWIPSWPSVKEDMSALLNYGGNLMGAQLISYCARNIDRVILGSQFGATAMGFYDRAFQLLMMPLNQINAPATSVALPVLSKLKEQKQRYDDFLIFGQSALMHIVLFMFCYACAMADPLIRFVLGEKWAPSIELFQILVVGGIFQAGNYVAYWYYLSQGITKSLFKYTIISRPVMIVLILIGSFWGIKGIAIGYSSSLIFNWIFGLIWLTYQKAPTKRMFANSVLLISVHSSAGIMAWSSVEYLGFSGVLAIIISPFIMLITYGLFYLIFTPFRENIQDMFRIKNMLRSSR